VRGRQLFAARDFAGARASFAEAMKRDPASSDALFWAGRADIASSAGMSYSRAIGYFERALVLDPARVQAHWGLGIARYSLSDYDAAEQELRAFTAGATEAEPAAMRAEAHHFLGLIAGTAGRDDAALAEFAAAAALNPAWADVPFERGRILEALGRKDEALAAYRAATRLEPNHLPAHFRLARLLRATGRDDEAAHEERIHFLLNTLTDNVTGKDVKTPGQRLDVYGELAQLDATNRSARLEYARALSELQRGPEAELALDELMKDAPDYADGCVLQATLALRGGRKGEAARRNEEQDDARRDTSRSARPRSSPSRPAGAAPTTTRARGRTATSTSPPVRGSRSST
jgi:tetratricopeptide (TPR) repeat protein